jgi:restriction endonuclease Mrr
MQNNENKENDMAIPDYQACMKPLLQALADGEEYPLSQSVMHLVKVFKLDWSKDQKSKHHEKRLDHGLP